MYSFEISLAQTIDMQWLQIIVLLRFFQNAQTTSAFISKDSSLFKQEISNQNYRILGRRSSECLLQNLLLDEKENKKFLFVRGSNDPLNSIQCNILSYNINLSDKKILAPLPFPFAINGPNYLIIFVDEFKGVDSVVDRLTNLMHISFEIHLIIDRKAISQDTELYLRLFPRTEIGKLRFHIPQDIGNDNYSWRLLQPNRKLRRGIHPLSECFFNETGTQLVRFERNTKCTRCTLNILARALEPYTYFDGTIGFHKGIEIFLMELIAERLGLKTKYILEAIDNWGMFKKLLGPSDTADSDPYSLIIGGYGNSTSLAPSNFVSTRIYIQDDSTWCVARNKPLPVWRNFFRMFENRRLIVLNAVAFFFSILLVYYFADRKFGGRVFCCHETFLFVMRLAMNMGYVSQAKKSFPRIMAAIFMIACLFHYHIFTSCYTGIIVFRIYDRQIQTEHELIRNHFHLAGDSDVYTQIVSESTVSLGCL